MLDNQLLNLKEIQGLSEKEREYLFKILGEMSAQGESKSLQDIRYSDYEEMPVDIETFLYDRRYLGNGLINADGKMTVFPYWIETLKKIFPNNIDTAYNTLILTGGIGLGKSFAADLCIAYLLHRMLCLKDPYLHYGLQPIDKITFSFINVTIEAAKGVGWDKIQQLFQSSPWFLEHGTLSGRNEIIWTPGKRIELVVGSSNNTVIGRALFCLDGETVIKTSLGEHRIMDLIDTPIKVVSIDAFGNAVLSDLCVVKPTVITNEEYQITLEDSSVIKCTSNHKLMLQSGEYIEAKLLKNGDILWNSGRNKYEHRVKIVKKIILPKPKQFYDVVEANPYNNFLIKTNSGYIVSHNCNFTDEINFAAMTSNVDRIKQKQMHLITQIDARMQSRFMRGTYLPTLNILASSKCSDQSFLESYIEMKRKNESTTTMVVDEPQWVIRTDKDSPRKFYVAVGNKFLASEVLPKDAPESMIDEYRSKGYKMLAVPEGYYEAFNDNVDVALTDIAGESSTSALKFISGEKLNKVKTIEYKNPFLKDTIEVGTNDNVQYSSFFDLSRVTKADMNKPLYVHLDMSKTGDKTGIAGVWIYRKQASADDTNAKEAYYKVAFSVSIKAPKGYEISFEKNRNFIRWLKQNGFKVKCVSSDTYQSAQIQQQLRGDGFTVETISVDRLESADGVSKQKICIPYAYLKQTINEKRLILYDKCDLLTNEIVDLEKEADGHINHPNGGTQGCFTCDTKISLVDGRELSLTELVDEFNSGKQNYVYSFNEKTKRVEPKLIEKAWCTLKNASLVEVTLDNGEKLRCTPNHKFMLRDSTYCEAQNLKAGDSLMPLYRKYLTETQSPLYEYRLYYEPMEDKWHYEHRRFCEEVLSDSKQIVHHKNCNKKDNSPCNLIYCSKGEHQKIHTELCTGAHSPEAERKKSLSISQWHENAKGTAVYAERSKKLHDANLKQHGRTEADYMEHQSKIAQQRIHGQELRKKAEETKRRKAEYIHAIESLYNVVWEDLSASERDGYGVKFQRFNYPETIESMRSAISAKHSLGEYENAKAALARCNQESKKLKELCQEVDLEKFFDIFGFEYTSLEPKRRASWVTKYRKIVCKKILNHRVVSVEVLDYAEDVYDLTVQDNHNFALTAGVFVHNSKDQVDSLCGAVYSASKHLDEFVYDYGEDLTTVTEVNTTINANEQISHEFEQELMRMFNPVKQPQASEEQVVAKQEENKQQEEKKVESKKPNFLDFGFGAAKPLNGQQYLSQGIIVW